MVYGVAKEASSCETTYSKITGINITKMIAALNEKIE